MRTAIRFFGVERTLFGSDSPSTRRRGPGYIRDTIANLQEMDIVTMPIAKRSITETSRGCSV